MTALDQWILELEQSRTSRRPQPLASTVDTAIAALQLIQGGLSPAGPEAANTVYAGPASGPNAIRHFARLS